MNNPNNRGDGVPPNNINADGSTKKKGWLPWFLLALGVLALLLGLNRCNRNKELAGVAPMPATTSGAPAQPGGVAVLTGTSRVGNYLAGLEALPRTFVFEKLNFDTAKSEIRAADRGELTDLAAAMKQHPNSRIRIVGYADARGDASANAMLGKERAESVKAALVAEGIDAGRLDTASGGETSPVDTNATAGGRAENRRTELIVLQR